MSILYLLNDRKMEKTQEMLDRAKNDNPCKKTSEENVMYSMRNFNDEFFV